MKIEQKTLIIFLFGTVRFIKGLAKKIIIANSLAIVADKTFSIIPGELSVIFAWLGIISYTLQIYFDFSGYSDMAIGLAKMFGFELEENFNFPYISKSITEFWRRWHISLGTWFKDYVYIPLGGNRVSKKRLIFNLFIVWFLTGLWHGANWTFIAWGIYYFILLIIEKITKFDKIKTQNALQDIIRIAYTLFFVMIGWVFFRSEGITQALQYIKSMFGINGNILCDGQTILYFREYIFYILAGAVLSVPIIKLKNKLKKMKFFNLYYILTIIILFIISLSYIIKGTYNPFIYFNF